MYQNGITFHRGFDIKTVMIWVVFRDGEMWMKVMIVIM